MCQQHHCILPVFTSITTSANISFHRLSAAETFPRVARSTGKSTKPKAQLQRCNGLADRALTRARDPRHGVICHEKLPDGAVRVGQQTA
jgi:hypothetical protein